MADWVFLAEPRTVLALIAEGKDAVTDEQPLDWEGRKVAVVVDNCEPSRRKGLRLACALDRIVQRVEVYAPPEQYLDVAQMLAAGMELRELVRL